MEWSNSWEASIWRCFRLEPIAEAAIPTTPERERVPCLHAVRRAIEVEQASVAIDLTYPVSEDSDIGLNKFDVPEFS